MFIVDVYECVDKIRIYVKLLSHNAINCLLIKGGSDEKISKNMFEINACFIFFVLIV